MKVWDAATGELLCGDARQPPHEPESQKSELFSMCLGARGRKVVVGDARGRIKVGHGLIRTK